MPSHTVIEQHEPLGFFDDPRQRGALLRFHAIRQDRDGNIVTARWLYLEALEAFQAVGLHRWLATTHLELARMEYRIGNYVDMHHHASEARNLAIRYCYPELRQQSVAALSGRARQAWAA